MATEPQQLYDAQAAPRKAGAARFKQRSGGRPVLPRGISDDADDSGQPASGGWDGGQSLVRDALKQSAASGSMRAGLRGAATGGALAYASKKIQESEQDAAVRDKYGSVLKVAGDAVRTMQQKHDEGQRLDLRGAAKVSKEAAVSHAGKAIKSGAQKKVAGLIAAHPELAAHAGELLNAETKNLDLTGKGGDKLAQAAVSKGIQSMAKSGGQIAARQVPIVGSISARDAMSGLGTGAKKLTQGNIGGAAKSVVGGLTKSLLVSGFRFSYQISSIVGSVGLSLIATAILGTILLFLPNRGVTFLEKLMVVALDTLLVILTLIILAFSVVLACNSSVGWGVWLASWVSETANSANNICAQVPGTLQSLGR